MSETVNQPNNSRVPLLGPLLEPGRMALVCIAAFAVAFFVCQYFAEDIFSFLIQPLMRAGQKSISYPQVFDAFFVRDKVAFFSAVIVLLPVFATQSWYLVGSQKHRKERRALLPFSLATPTLFLIGVATAYFLAIPVMLHLLIALPSVSGDVQQVPQVVLPDVTDALSAMSVLYVLEGSTLGGAIIVGMLEKRGITTGISFFSGYGADTMNRWRAFVAALNQLPQNPEDVDRAVNTVRETFDCFLKVFQEVPSVQ
ncbi:MAG: twin-arginine translocase subunit TatC [Cytophagaceae bacterium]|nr:MAG: twin-arginine translocase subunit TatC [Cytophagaceae bacterium]